MVMNVQYLGRAVPVNKDLEQTSDKLYWLFALYHDDKQVTRLNVSPDFKSFNAQGYSPVFEGGGLLKMLKDELACSLLARV